MFVCVLKQKKYHVYSYVLVWFKFYTFSLLYFLFPMTFHLRVVFITRNVQRNNIQICIHSRPLAHLCVHMITILVLNSIQTKVVHGVKACQRFGKCNKSLGFGRIMRSCASPQLTPTPPNTSPVAEFSTHVYMLHRWLYDVTTPYNANCISLLLLESKVPINGNRYALQRLGTKPSIMFFSCWGHKITFLFLCSRVINFIFP